MRRSIFGRIAVVLGLALVPFCLTGCGGGGGAATHLAGVTAVGTLVTASQEHLVMDTVIDYGNPNYPNVFIAPSAYKAAVTKFELMKSADDPNPYVIFDTSTESDPGGVTNPRLIDLAGNGDSATFGSNTTYPPAGTYTHVRFTLAYLQMTFPADIGDGWESTMFRVYASTVGNVQDGDVLVYKNNVWNWIYHGGYYDVAGDRPGEVVQQAGFKDDTPDSPDPWSMTMALPTPVTIPANPDGHYLVSVNFDVTKSPEIPGSTGTFVFDDVTEDGKFKPGIPTAQGGDDVHDDPVRHDSPGDWNTLPPTISVTCTKK